MKTPSSLTLSALKYACGLSFAAASATTQSADLRFPLPDNVIAQQNGAHIFYGDKDDLKSLGTVTQRMSAIAQQPIFLGTPQSLKDFSVLTWPYHDFIKNLEPLNPLIANSREEQHRERFSSYRQRIIRNNSAGVFFADNYNGIDNGKKTGCFIGGRLNEDPLQIARDMGKISAKLETQAFRNLFNIKSFNTFIMLHESAHCPQPSRATLEDLFQRLINPLETLRYEIDADGVASPQYVAETANDPELDPQMPQKIQALRVLSPALLLSFVPRSTVSGNILRLTGLNTHTTAGINKSGGDMEHAQQASFSAGLFINIAAMLIRETTPASKNGYLRAEVRQDIILFERTIKHLAKASDGKVLNRGFAGLKSFVQGGLEGHIAMADDPAKIYLVAKFITKNREALEKNSPNLKPVIEYADKVVNSWKLLNLATPSEETYTQFETALRSAPGRYAPPQILKLIP